MGEVVFRDWVRILMSAAGFLLLFGFGVYGLTGKYADISWILMLLSLPFALRVRTLFPGTRFDLDDASISVVTGYIVLRRRQFSFQDLISLRDDPAIFGSGDNEREADRLRVRIGRRFHNCYFASTDKKNDVLSFIRSELPNVDVSVEERPVRVTVSAPRAPRRPLVERRPL